jgi:hypothetical protein
MVTHSPWIAHVTPVESKISVPGSGSGTYPTIFNAHSASDNFVFLEQQTEEKFFFNNTPPSCSGGSDPFLRMTEIVDVIHKLSKHSVFVVCFRWENFVDRDIKIGGRTIVHMKLLKENIIATRAKTSIIITCWKIVVTVLFAYIFHHGIFNTSVIFPTNYNNNDQIEDPLPKLSPGQNAWSALSLDPQPAQGMFPILPPPRDRRSIVNTSAYIKRLKRQIDNDLPSTFTYDEETLNSIAGGGGGNNPGGSNGEETNPKDRWIIYLAPMILKILSDALCFYMGRLACKLCMQRICFALPITLVTPLALTILLVMCSVAPKSTVFVENFLFWSCYADYAKESFRWQVICGLVLWWLSELWIGGHIWFGKSQRLAFTER